MDALALKVSVIIRTRDRERYFDQLMENLARQTIRASEIVIVDNYSTEKERQILENELYEIGRKWFRDSGTRLKFIALSDNEFSHAYSSNLGVETAENELVCLTNAHSIPISLSWLQDGLRHFEDSSVAGVSGFFIPHREGKVMGKLDLMLYYFSQKMVLHQDWCSTINCIIRKSLWKIYPFDENLPKLIPEAKRYGLEDYDWSKEMTAKGYKIIVDPLFSVFHSHSKGPSELARNTRSYFIYRRIQQKINLFDRPRESFSRVFPAEDSRSMSREL
jgi:glycosyltransferase involved in cell wall biosynthesis